MFKIRTKKPTSTKCYITRGNGGWSWCIQGYPKDSQCDVLANCVGYACGRFNEVYNEIKGTTGMKYYALNCNAENFIERAKSTYGLEVVSYPVKGGIMVWQGKGNLAGHVAFVEKVYDSNHIYTSESGYGGNAFWNSHRYNDNGRWGLGSNYPFLGCIVNPAVGKVTVEGTPEPTPSTGKFKLGDKVVLNGYLYRDAMGNGKGAYKTNHKGTIKIVYAKGTKPYHIDGLGWVAEADIKLQSSGSSVVYYPKCSSKYGSIVDALRSIGVDATYANRCKIAKINDISGYAGTANQNVHMLNLLKQGKLIKSK